MARQTTRRMTRGGAPRGARWVVGLGALAATPAAARPSWVHGQGILLSGDSRGDGRGGFGWESSFNRLTDDLTGLGGVVQLEFDLDGGVRLALLGQGFSWLVGVEVGPALYLDPAHDLSVELQVAPFVSLGVVTAAGRLLWTGEGLIYGGSMAFKLHFDPDGEVYPSGNFGNDCEEDPFDPDTKVVCGRPLRGGDGRAWRAPVMVGGPARRDALWAAAQALDPVTRRRLAAAWLDDARDEHAAIGAFRRLAGELQAHGAPRALVEGARRAARDEVRHARAAFAVASALAGRRLAPLPVAAPGRARPTRAALAAESWLDGAMNEGQAAAEARVGHAGARVPAVRGLLGAIGREEARHAALGAAVAAWAAGEGRAARRALERARDTRAAVEAPRAAEGAVVRAWGRVASGRALSGG